MKNPRVELRALGFRDSFLGFQFDHGYKREADQHVYTVLKQRMETIIYESNNNGFQFIQFITH